MRNDGREATWVQILSQGCGQGSQWRVSLFHFYWVDSGAALKSFEERSCVSWGSDIERQQGWTQAESLGSLSDGPDKK